MADNIKIEKKSDIEPDDIKNEEPKLYKVIFHNDDYTPMEFVAEMLFRIFHKPMPVASNLTMKIHTMGSAIAGIYSKEIAEIKIVQVQIEAESKGYPLYLTSEVE